MGRTD